MSSSPTRNTQQFASSVQVLMPQMGISVAEGTIIEWRKQPGEWVEADETICDVSTDKVDVEIPSPAAGRLERILVEAGTTVSVGTVLAELDAGPAGPVTEDPGPAGPVTNSDPPHLGSAEARSPESAPPAGEASERDRSGFYSPVVRRIAEEHGVDLEEVEGHGVGGRVRKSDVVAYLESGKGNGAAGRPMHIESPYRPESDEEPGQAEANGAADPQDLFGPTRREPMSPMRQQIARHMLESRRSSAHCTTIVEVDFSRVAARRAELREAMSRRGVKLTYLAFVARSAVAALEAHPVLNASIEGEEIVYHEDVNLGIAVALEDGLIVPVIRRAQRLSLEGMAAAIADVADRARERRLEPDDVRGGTFTITNPGQFGAVLATPIINQPQVAILDLEAVVKRAVVVGDGGSDAIAIRPMSYLCMSWDHRALDGVEAARFLGSLKDRLEAGSTE